MKPFTWFSKATEIRLSPIERAELALAAIDAGQEQQLTGQEAAALILTLAGLRSDRLELETLRSRVVVLELDLMGYRARVAAYASKSKGGAR